MAFPLAAAPVPAPFLGALTAGDVVTLINTSTFFGKFILLVLLAASVVSWAIFIDKYRALRRIRRGHQAFWDLCERWFGGQVDKRQVADWCRGHADLPVTAVWNEAAGARDLEGVRRSCERAAYLELEHLERYIVVLSTTVTAAPFLGLLGTVWGIMASFWSMASMHSANLTVVAPGIAEALITTVAGLAAAIPAVAFYNLLIRRIDLVTNEMDRVRSILEETLDRAPSRQAQAQPEDR